MTINKNTAITVVLLIKSPPTANKNATYKNTKTDIKQVIKKKSIKKSFNLLFIDVHLQTVQKFLLFLF